MERRHHVDAFELEPGSAHPGDRQFRVIQQALQGGSAQCDDHFGVEERDLRLEIRHTGLHLLEVWVAIPRWTAFYHIGDEDLFPHIAHALDHASEQLSRNAHEREALEVFVGTRAFADE